MYIIANDR